MGSERRRLWGQNEQRKLDGHRLRQVIRVCAPNGVTCEMFGDSDDAHQRFAYFVLRQMIRDLAEVTEDRDAYRVSSEIRGANIEAMHEVLIELSALLAGQATDFRQVARDLRRMARASLDCSP